MSSSDFNSNDALTVKTEAALPVGWKLISDSDGALSLNDRQRKELIVFDVSREESTKTIWLLAVRSAYQGVQFMQIQKRATSLGYRIVKDGIIDSALLSVLYNRKNTIEQQQKQKNNSAVITEFEKIVAYALSERISDIHILVRPNGTSIEMRKNGELQPYGDELRRQEDGINLCSVMYTVLANTKSTNFDARLFQQAAIDYSINDQEFKLRYQSLPAYPDGFNVVLRLLPIGRSEEFTPLVKLGYTQQQHEDLWKIGSSPEGALIIAGITGSGKSTTCKNLLMSINAEAGYKIRCYTIEDPPEYNIARVTQIPVPPAADSSMDSNKKVGSVFEMPIKACMRADPDIIMIGEVRDHITGDLTKKAVQSGHQVITTVHATSAAGIVERFIDFGLSRSTLGSPNFLSGLLYQKLLGIVCTHCCFHLNDLVSSSDVTKREAGIYKRISKYVNPKDFDICVRNHKGCSKCSGGLTGRTVCAEIIVVDYNIIKLISTKDSVDLIQYWRGLSDNNPSSTNMRGKTCMEHAFQKMLSGICCPFEVEGSFRSIEDMKMIDITVSDASIKKESKKEESSENDLDFDESDIDVDSENFTLNEQ